MVGNGIAWLFSSRFAHTIISRLRNCGSRRVREQPWQTERIESIVSQFGSSRIFLEHYRREVLRDKRVTVILRAILLQFEMDPLSRPSPRPRLRHPDLLWNQ